jgi:hypothetical protein
MLDFLADFATAIPQKLRCIRAFYCSSRRKLDGGYRITSQFCARLRSLEKNSCGLADGTYFVSKVERDAFHNPGEISYPQITQIDLEM